MTDLARLGPLRRAKLTFERYWVVAVQRLPPWESSPVPQARISGRVHEVGGQTF